MQSSSNRNPCPACQRSSDGDCRWNEDLILCHSGTDLLIGQTTTINGTQWALIRLEGGHSGRAAVFKPHRPRRPGKKDYFPRHSNQDLLSLQAKRSQWADIFDQFFAAFDAAWNIPDFYSCTPEQLKAAEEVINDAQAKAAALRPHLRTIWRDHPDLDQLHRLRVDSQLKSLAYIAEHFRYFQINELATSCPAAVHEIAERF
ncbi:hypothetical protein PMIT1318_00309 [Prochlorococcus marinus str. MIT 1318]|uniref:hypothetical protein n=1 Tax=Prochlorococcus TaxID=1218 RepID=UPI0007B3A1A9|nr:hypothetical protein [Prochlorococcus marinus]KZR75223.1 hypothetical protein PMIT1318_00309 [Prochlorococcus marinus str. MIT 1318]